MAELNAEEQAVADALRRGGAWPDNSAAARVAVAALDLPARDARIRAQVAEEIAVTLERANTGSDTSAWIYFKDAARIAREHATAREAP